MRLALLLSAAGLSGIALIAAAPTQPPAAILRNVSVTAICTAPSVQLTVNPWVLRLNAGDTVQWQLTPASNADSIWVDRKRGPRWPFAGPPRGGNRGRPAHSGGAANLRGRHQYNIYLRCTLGADTVIVLLDPDMVIE
ncbi:MAG: hypothetical protein KatS3mg081_1614 [Gemmatimonadales bacterium]|nr:MAG: hypothetical protein KatS3mg081_1614 [Gemmatimonadales bacterium]